MANWIPSGSDVVGGMWEAFVSFFTGIFTGIFKDFSTTLTRALIRNLLRVESPYNSPAADAAWQGVFEISLVLVPILVAASLIVWPFSEEREGGMMGMIVRLVAIMFFIGISKPAWSFAIDATNAVTIAILNTNVETGQMYGFSSDVLGTYATNKSFELKFIVSIFAGLLAFIGVILATFLLVMRWYLIWLVYIGTPLFAVLWFAGRGPLESIGKFAATFLRMGIYSLLAGPVIALVVLTFSVIENGGIMQAADGVGSSIAALSVELILMFIFPFMLVIVTWKMISWAGQPIGAGEAAGMGIMAAAALATAGAGVAAGAVGGGAAAAGGGAAAAGGGGGAAAAGSGASGAASAGASASGAGASASGATGATGANAGGSLSSKLAGKADSAISSVANKANQYNPVGALGDKINEQKEDLNAAEQDAAQAAEQSDILNAATPGGSFNLEAANDAGILEEPPADGAEAQVATDGSGALTASYTGKDGGQHSVDLTQKAQEADAASIDAGKRKSAAKGRLESLTNKQGSKTGKAAKAAGAGTRGSWKVGKAIAKPTAAATKIGTGAMVGAATGNPYLGYSMSRRAADKMISANGNQQPEAEDPNTKLDEYGVVNGKASSNAHEGEF